MRPREEAGSGGARVGAAQVRQVPWRESVSTEVEKEACGGATNVSNECTLLRYSPVEKVAKRAVMVEDRCERAGEAVQAAGARGGG